MSREHFLPALRWKALTPAFDRLMRLTSHERRCKRLLLDLAQVRAGERVLDVGAGTGTLATDLKTRCPESEVVGLDADEEILSLARAKADSANAAVTFVQAYSSSLPFDSASFDVVLSSLFFHHLEAPAKVATLAEIRRVLKPGGRMWVADLGKPQDVVMRLAVLAVQLLDGFAPTEDNVRGRLPALFREAGFYPVRTAEEMRTPLGTVAIYSAR